MKILDFICELFSPRKSAAIITRNEVLEEAIDAIQIDAIRVDKLMMSNELFTTECIMGFHAATRQAVMIIDNLKK